MDDELYLTTTYLLERKDEKPVVAYCRSIKVDADNYIKIISKDEETVDSFEGENWSKVDIKIRRIYQNKTEHDAFIKNLSGGKFKIGEGTAVLELPVANKPNVYQLDKDTIRVSGVIDTPESGMKMLAIVESFWQKDTVKNITESLDPALNSKLEEIAKSGNKEEKQYVFFAKQELNKRLIRFVKIMKDKTGLSFDGAYAGRFGSIEIIDVPRDEHIITNPLFKIQIDKKEEGQNIRITGLKIIRDKDNQEEMKQKRWVHVTLSDYNEIVKDCLVCLEKEEISIPIETAISEYEVMIFNDKPESEMSLCFIEGRHLVRQINTNMSMLSYTKYYEDKLSKKLKAYKELKIELENITSESPSQTIVGGYDYDQWVPHARSLKNMFDNIKTEQRETKWFPRGINSKGEGDAFSYIRKLIDESKNKKVWIVDPFFYITAFERLLPRLRNTGIDLCIILSCLGGNPDEEDINLTTTIVKDTPEQQEEKIVKWCKRNQAMLNPKFRVLNIKKGEAKQAFHDRYLVTEDAVGGIDVYSLSSSINKLAGDYPCSINKIEKSMGNVIFGYIQGLELGIDVTANTDGEEKHFKVAEIWNSVEARNKQQKHREAPKNILENGPVYFPFWKKTICYLLDIEESTDEKKIIEKVVDNGMAVADREKIVWKLNKDVFGEVVSKRLKKAPDAIENISEILTGLGEMEAYGHHEEIDYFKVILEATKEWDLLDVKTVLDNMEKWYLDNPPPDGIKDIFDTIDSLGSRAYLNSEKESFELLRGIASLIENYYHYYGAGLYGLKFAITYFLNKQPEQAIEWISDVKRENSHVCSVIISVLINTVTLSRDENICKKLLKSVKPFFRLFGIAGLFWGEDLNVFKKVVEKFDNIVEILRKNGISNENLLWISALPVADAQARVYKFKDKPEKDEEVEKAKINLNDLLTKITVAEYVSFFV